MVLKKRNVCLQCKKVRLSVLGASKMNVCQFSFVVFILERNLFLFRQTSSPAQKTDKRPPPKRGRLLVPKNTSKWVQRLLKAEAAVLLKSLPQIKSCPEISGSLTHDWLNFTSSLSDGLASRLPGFTSTVISFSSLPAKSEIGRAHV